MSGQTDGQGHSYMHPYVGVKMKRYFEPQTTPVKNGQTYKGYTKVVLNPLNVLHQCSKKLDSGCPVFFIFKRYQTDA